MKVDDIEGNEEHLCWKAVPVEYDNFLTEDGDKYEGYIFGVDQVFISPHFLWRRFHKNYMKAMLMTKLLSYQLVENEEDLDLYEQIELLEKNYSLEVIARHNAIVFIVTAVEAFLKDSFKEILVQIFPEKIKSNNLTKTIKRFNFQNIKSINIAFDWLCEDFDVPVEDENIDRIFQLRHKIVHKSHYNKNYSNEQFIDDSSSILVWIDAFDYYFNERGYWDKVIPKN